MVDGRDKMGQNRRQIQNLPWMPLACQMCPPRDNSCRAFWFTNRGPWRRSSLSIKSLWNITCLEWLWRAWTGIANWAPLGDALRPPFNRALFRLRFSNPGVQRLNENVHLLRILRYLRERRSNGDCPITYHYYILAQLAVSIHRSILYTSPLFIWFVFRTLMSMNPLFYVLGTIQKLVWCRANYQLEWGQPQAIYIRGRWGTS